MGRLVHDLACPVLSFDVPFVQCMDKKRQSSIRLLSAPT